MSRFSAESGRNAGESCRSFGDLELGWNLVMSWRWDWILAGVAANAVASGFLLRRKEDALSILEEGESRAGLSVSEIAFAVAGLMILGLLIRTGMRVFRAAKK